MPDQKQPDDKAPAAPPPPPEKPRPVDGEGNTDAPDENVPV